MKANKLLDSQGLCVRRQHDINEHCGVVGDDAERRMFCKSCPPPTIRVNRAGCYGTDHRARLIFVHHVDSDTQEAALLRGWWSDG